MIQTISSLIIVLIITNNNNAINTISSTVYNKTYFYFSINTTCNYIMTYNNNAYFDYTINTASSFIQNDSTHTAYYFNSITPFVLKHKALCSKNLKKRAISMCIFMGFPETAWNQHFHLEKTKRSRETEKTGKQGNGNSI